MLELCSSQAEFDTSRVLWTGSFWCIASVNKSLCWFRGEIWPMHKKKDNGGSSWQCLQISQNLQWLLQHSDMSNEGIREKDSGFCCPCFVCTFLTEHPSCWGWFSRVKISLQLRLIIFQQYTLKCLKNQSWIIVESHKKPGVAATKALFSIVHLSNLLSPYCKK